MSKTGTGTSRKVSKEKISLRGATTATRPTIPDDMNDRRTYADWQPGKLRPFMPQFSFKHNPSHVLKDGPGSSVGGHMNAIKDSDHMRHPSILKVSKT